MTHRQGRRSEGGIEGWMESWQVGGAEEEDPRRSSWVRCGIQTKDGQHFSSVQSTLPRLLMDGGRHTQVEKRFLNQLFFFLFLLIYQRSS